jgi:hypothetical protein
MSQWWLFAMATIWKSQPWDTWFWDQLPETAWGWPGWVYGSQSYWFMKISPSGGHKQQLAIRSPADRTSIAGYSVKKDVIYICCYRDDTPNWGGISSLVSISPPCSNWCTALYQVPEEVTRSQTSGLKAAIQDGREIKPGIRATVARTGELADAITASIQAYRDAPVTLQAAVRGTVTRSIPIKAAVRTERDLAPGIEAAVARTAELPVSIQAAIQGCTQLPIRTRAAIRGEAQMSVGIIANVVVSRAPQIYLEMENLVPQEFDLRSTPNWPSRVKDWRAESLGQ